MRRGGLCGWGEVATVNPRLEKLHAYPFERLARLKAGAVPPAGLAHIAMSIGEPQHVAPAFVLETLRGALDQLGSYPATAGVPEFWGGRARGVGGGGGVSGGGGGGG